MWIGHISYEASEDRLRKLYDRIKGPDNNVDNIMLAHSLRPHTMEGHLALYKSVLHHFRNTLDKWYLEAIGVYVSLINQCGYCVEHHFNGMKRLIADNGARIDDAPLTDAGLMIDAAALASPIKLSAGKKRHALVTLAD